MCVFIVYYICLCVTGWLTNVLWFPDTENREMSLALKDISSEGQHKHYIKIMWF